MKNDDEQLSRAAASAFGRMGGRVRSKAKLEACKRNARHAGKPWRIGRFRIRVRSVTTDRASLRAEVERRLPKMRIDPGAVRELKTPHGTVIIDEPVSRVAGGSDKVG